MRTSPVLRTICGTVENNKRKFDSMNFKNKKQQRQIHKLYDFSSFLLIVFIRKYAKRTAFLKTHETQTNGTVNRPKE